MPSARSIRCRVSPFQNLVACLLQDGFRKSKELPKIKIYFTLDQAMKAQTGEYRYNSTLNSEVCHPRCVFKL